MNVQEVGKELGVRYVLEGSVQKANNRVRINVQLIDAATSGHLWAERYDRELNDIFALQDEVIQRVAAALQVVAASAVTLASFFLVSHVAGTTLNY